MKRKVRIYTCDKHPGWSLENGAPKMAGELPVMCPLCRDAFIIANIGLPECRVEEREVQPTWLVKP